MVKRWFKHFPVVILVTFFFLRYSHAIYAQEFRNDYQVEYFLSQNGDRLNTRVKFKITITNLVSDLYVKQFSLGFPKSFLLHDLRAYDDHVEVKPELATDKETTKISLQFSDPQFGKGSQNTFILEFFQDNLFTVNGNVWEVIIPTVYDRTDSNYRVLVHLPQGQEKKVSLSKPSPDLVEGNTIIWNNPSTKTIYAVFGDTQYYKADLTYNLKNDGLIPAYTDIALPPDTLTQQIFIEQLDPFPSSVSLDSDGNYLARYVLRPREAATVRLKSVVAVFANPREEVIPFVRKKLESQKKYLLEQSSYWTLPDGQTIAKLGSSPEDIYRFVTGTLTYDYNKVNSNNTRLGAKQVLEKPDRAVCMEFTDLFVALARGKGIYAREIEGYGFTQDPNLRPLSLVSDVLHAWPEYYDTSLNYWIAIDPTWEDTSGIDYFSSFDLNHITFAIHGKRPDYPYPAGTYKTSDSRDVHIEAISQMPAVTEKLVISQNAFTEQINDSQVYTLHLTVKNAGNVYYWGKDTPIEATNVNLTPSSLQISPLAPGEVKNIAIIVKASEKTNILKNGHIRISPLHSNSILVNFSIIPFYYDIALKISLFITACVVLVSLVFLYKKRRGKIMRLR